MEVTQRRKELEMKVLLVSCPDFSPQVGSKELEKFDHLKTSSKTVGTTFMKFCIYIQNFNILQGCILNCPNCWYLYMIYIDKKLLFQVSEFH